VTRELFDTLLLWSGRVKLDERGRASLEVPLNDSLTSFKIVAVATSGLNRFGTGSTTIRSTQDLMVLSGIAPLVREGDEIRNEFTVRNTSDKPMKVAVEAAVEGIAKPLPKQDVELAPGEAKVVEWPVTAPEGVAKLEYRIDAKAAGAEDIEEKPIVGAPVDALVELAEQVKADLLVVGNVGLSTIAGRLLGSVPANVARRSKTDVLIVHTS